MINLKKRYYLDETPLKFIFKGSQFSFMIDDINESSKIGDISLLSDLDNRLQVKLSKIGNCYYRITDHLKISDKNSIIDEMKSNYDFMSRVFDIINLIVLNINPRSLDVSDITGDKVFILNDRSSVNIVIKWSMSEIIQKDKLLITII
jgi:hypothetical protein